MRFDFFRRTPHFVPVDTNGVRVLRARVSLTQAEFENLNASPKTLIAAVPGCIIRPIAGLVQVTIASAYGGANTMSMQVNSLTMINTIQAIQTATGLKTPWGVPIAGAPAAGVSIVNKALTLNATANIAGGSITGTAIAIVDYVIVPGLL